MSNFFLLSFEDEYLSFLSYLVHVSSEIWYVCPAAIWEQFTSPIWANFNLDYLNEFSEPVSQRFPENYSIKLSVSPKVYSLTLAHQIISDGKLSSLSPQELILVASILGSTTAVNYADSFWLTPACETNEVSSTNPLKNQVALAIELILGSFCKSAVQFFICVEDKKS